MTRNLLLTCRCQILQVRNYQIAFSIFKAHRPNYAKGRAGTDADMAACILFLAGPGGLFFNAQVLYPDGGECLPTHGVLIANDVSR